MTEQYQQRNINNPAPNYIQASDGANQVIAAANTPQVVRHNTVDEAFGISIESDNTFILSDAGVYTLIAAPQVGSGGAADFRCFWRRSTDDGATWVNIANSNVLMGLLATTKDVIISQGVLALNAGDRLQVMMSGSTTNPLLEAITKAGEPLVPSIITSIFQIGYEA